ncbi:MAG: hypothetical protein P8M79_03175, partial [Alphaproteobacteria bacterium]|nr:hypothetical protein [Alphaproteobacteria bacterium]
GEGRSFTAFSNSVKNNRRSTDPRAIGMILEVECQSAVLARILVKSNRRWPSSSSHASAFVAISHHRSLSRLAFRS